MPLSRTSCHVIALLALAMPLQAHADAVALTPLLKDRKVPTERVQDIFSLMSSELEFMQGVDEVIEIDPPPPSLIPSCLDSTRCLGAITRDSKADTLLTGAIEMVGDRLLVDMLYYDVRTNKVVRRNTFDLSAQPAELVDGMTPMLVEILTGVSPVQEREASEMTDVDFGADLAGEDMGFYEEPTRTIQPAPVPAEPSRAGSTRAVSRTITAPPVPPEPEPEDDGFNPDDFSFGSSAEDISFGDSSADITYTPPPAQPVREAPPAPAPRQPTYEEERLDRYDPDVIEMELAEDADLDRGQSRTASSTRSTTQRNNKSNDSDEWRRLHIQVKGGYTNYGVFNFGTVELEAKVRVSGGLFVHLGGGLNFVRRCVPFDPNEAGREFITPDPVCGDPSLDVTTDFIVPVQLGMLYHFKPGKFQPYVGVDGQFAQIYVESVFDEDDQLIDQIPYFTGGARFRAGFDVFFTRNFGLNLDAALGFWMGDGWRLIDPRNPSIGFMPHISGGILVGF